MDFGLPKNDGAPRSLLEGGVLGGEAMVSFWGLNEKRCCKVAVFKEVEMCKEGNDLKFEYSNLSKYLLSKIYLPKWTISP